jgi:uncharacterized protein (DUF4415 family)
MKKRATTATSNVRLQKPSRGRVNRAFLDRQSDADIERTAPPELANLPDDFWDDAVVVQPAFKQAISLRVDRDVLDWFKHSGPRYQSRINAVLRAYMTHQRPVAAKKRRVG